MSAIKPKPCRFCGSDVVLIEKREWAGSLGYAKFQAICEGCDSRGPSINSSSSDAARKESESLAIECWNKVHTKEVK